MSPPVAMQLDAPIQGAHGETNAHFARLRGNLRFPARPGVFLTVSVAVVFLMLAYLLGIVAELREVFRSLRQGRPFSMANAYRIRRLGFAVLFGELGRAAVVYCWSDYTSRYFVADVLRFPASMDLNLFTLVGGLTVLVLAEVFRQGARLQEEQSLAI